MSHFNEKIYIPQVSIDCVIFGYSKGVLNVLITKVLNQFETYALPGGFIKQTESLQEAAHRITLERTGIDHIYLDQFSTFGNTDRYNEAIIQQISEEWLQERGISSSLDEFRQWFNRRFISIGFYALLDIRQVILKKSPFDQSLAWYSIHELPGLIMDHNQITLAALESLRQDFDRKQMAFPLLPETFTMRSLQEVYEAVFDRPLARNNFQKKMLDLNILERLEKVYSGAAHKAPYLYRLKK
ncbi:MAG: NrtR DNA-binding winged helix domain-containing protein [Spirosomataceae bacterium]